MLRLRSPSPGTFQGRTRQKPCLFHQAGPQAGGVGARAPLKSPQGLPKPYPRHIATLASGPWQSEARRARHLENAGSKSRHARATCFAVLPSCYARGGPEGHPHVRETHESCKSAISTENPRILENPREFPRASLQNPTQSLANS